MHKCLHHLADTMSSARVTIPHLIWIGFSRWLCTAEVDGRGAANHSALITLGHCKAFLQGAPISCILDDLYFISRRVSSRVKRVVEAVQCDSRSCNLSPQWGTLIFPVMYLDFVFVHLFSWIHLLFRIDLLHRCLSLEGDFFHSKPSK